MNIFRKVYRLLSSSQRRDAFVLMPLMVFGMFLEAISLGAVVPVTSIMVKGNLSQYPFLHFATDGLKIGEEKISCHFEKTGTKGFRSIHTRSIQKPRFNR